MEDQIKETFNPVYKDVEQVKKCVAYMLGEEIEEAKIAIVIGHNGKSFVSSTDWRLTTVSGKKRIMPFSVRPQYPNFLECVAGVKYSGEGAKFSVHPDRKRPRGAIVEVDGEKYVFAPGETLKLCVKPNSRFIATDCTVVCEDDGIGARVYRIETDEDTLYGLLDNNGGISQV